MAAAHLVLPLGLSPAGRRPEDNSSSASARRHRPRPSRIRFSSGDHTDVTYGEAETVAEDRLIEHVIATLAAPDGVLRCRHGDRLLALFSRGVASVEIGPRGAVL